MKIHDGIAKSRSRDHTRLKTRIIPSYVIAHQEFALHLLNWLPSLFDKWSGFRSLFAEIAFSSEAAHKVELPGPEVAGPRCLTEALMLNDAHVWKAVRKAWLKIAVEGVLRDYEAKLLFSRV